MNALYSNRFASSTMSRLLPLWSLLALLGFAACDSSTGIEDEVPVREPGTVSYTVTPPANSSIEPVKVDATALFIEAEGLDERGIETTLFSVQIDIKDASGDHAGSAVFGLYGEQPGTGTYRIGPISEASDGMMADYPYDGAFGVMSFRDTSEGFEVIESVTGTLVVERSNTESFQATFDLEAERTVLGAGSIPAGMPVHIEGAFNALSGGASNVASVRMASSLAEGVARAMQNDGR